MSPSSLTAVYVSWRDTEQLLASLRQLAESADGQSVSVVVVVNEASGAEASRIGAVWPGANVLANEINRGFGLAANQGAAVADGEVLLFLNPDTSAKGHPCAGVLRAFEEHPSAVAVAPQLIDAKPTVGMGQRLFQLRRLPTLRSDARELLLFDHLFPANPGLRKSRYLDCDRDQPLVVEQAAAAALAVRLEAFQAIGGFDERFFPAYWEDVDLCKRLGQLGEILYWPGARFEHVGGVSATELGQGSFRRVYYRNALRYRAKHYSTLAGLAYRMLLALGMLLRILAVAVQMGGPTARREGLRGLASVAMMAMRPLPADPGS